MSQRITNVDKLILVYRKLFSRYKIQLYASHNQEDFHTKLLNLNAHYIDYQTNITGMKSSGPNGGSNAVYEIYVKKIDYPHAELAMNTTAHR